VCAGGTRARTRRPTLSSSKSWMTPRSARRSTSGRDHARPGARGPSSRRQLPCPRWIGLRWPLRHRRRGVRLVLRRPNRWCRWWLHALVASARTGRSARRLRVLPARTQPRAPAQRATSRVRRNSWVPPLRRRCRRRLRHPAPRAVAARGSTRVVAKRAASCSRQLDPPQPETARRAQRRKDRCPRDAIGAIRHGLHRLVRGSRWRCSHSRRNCRATLRHC
jgi:hypothetical protein